MPITAAALLSWMAIVKSCSKKCRECSSPVSALILCPSSLMKEVASGLNTHDVSMATRMKWWMELRRVTFGSLPTVLG